MIHLLDGWPSKMPQLPVLFLSDKQDVRVEGNSKLRGSNTTLSFR